MRMMSPDEVEAFLSYGTRTAELATVRVCRVKTIAQAETAF